MFNKRTSTGIFIPAKNGFVQYTGDQGNGSINSITTALGYELDQVYGPNIGDINDKINYVCFEVFSRNIVYVMTPKQTTFITERDIKKFLGVFSVTKYFDTQKISESLTYGIENSSMPIEFLARVLKLNDVSRNGMFYAKNIDTYLYFTDGMLTDFHFDDGLFPGARSLRVFNRTVYDWISELAYKYWPNDAFQAKKEINIQCEAWASIPGAFGNEYIPLHRTENGGANLHMIKVCHYGHPINIDQFKEINHGRYSTTKKTSADHEEYICGMFSYIFDPTDGDLLKIILLDTIGNHLKIIFPDIADVD